MMISKAVVLMLKGDVAKSFMADFNSAKLKPYSSAQREAALSRLEKMFEKRDIN